MDYSKKLEEMAYIYVKRDDYIVNTPTIEDEIAIKQQEINDLKSGVIEKPQPKSKYFEILSLKETELNLLKEKNNQIIKLNNDNKIYVDNKYIVDIEDYKKDINNIWGAIRIIRNDLLSQSDWTQIADSPKYNNINWLNYRQALRDITKQENVENIIWPMIPSD